MPGPIRSLLTTATVQPAGRACNCAHDRRHRIQKGEARFVVKNPGTLGEKGYCAACARTMLRLTRSRLEELEADCT